MSERHGKSWLLGVAVATLAAVSLSGCGIGDARDPEILLEVERLEGERAALQSELGQCQVEIKQLEEQIQALSGLPENGRENPYPLKGINITRYTNFYDKDEDGRKEKLIVYVEPVDVEDDTLKATGTAHVQLWNLNKPTDQALLGQWEIQPDALRKLWFKTLVSTSYRLTFDAPAGTEILSEPLTVKVNFTDSLTGKIFRDQHVIEPGSQP
ncbi:MAG: hypothetical protein JW741_18795 [Sedimentisphaerales bacterium]|nr:hypothetical protein [Sedimentisphaerales bacterium]